MWNRYPAVKLWFGVGSEPAGLSRLTTFPGSSFIEVAYCPRTVILAQVSTVVDTERTISHHNLCVEAVDTANILLLSERERGVVASEGTAG